MTARKLTSHSYFVVMQETSRGLEATVQPEITRREVVSRINSGEYRDIVFIHYVEGLFVEDLTAEILAECEPTESPASSPVECAAWDLDYRRDSIKNWVG